LAALPTRKQPREKATPNPTDEEPSHRHGDEFACPEHGGGHQVCGESERERSRRECSKSDAPRDGNADETAKTPTVVHCPNLV